MNNLTTVLKNKLFNYDIEEWTKQDQKHTFENGKEQRITNYSIPAIEMKLSYRGLTQSDYNNLVSAYEANYASSFIYTVEEERTTSYKIDGRYLIQDYLESQDNYVEREDNQFIYECETVNKIDMRDQIMGVNASTWFFKSFEFSVDAKTRLYEGSISLITSVFFNYPKYQELFSQSSNYLMSSTTDLSFIEVLDECCPNKVDLSYDNSSVFSNIGKSVKYSKDKGLKRKYKLHFLTQESQWLKFLTFYRKKGGIMGEFGFPVDFINNAEDEIIKVRFLTDSFSYQKGLHNIYQFSIEIVEVK